MGKPGVLLIDDEETAREIKQVVTGVHCLHRALDALEDDHAFLTEGGVFSKDFIDSFIALNREEQKSL